MDGSAHDIPLAVSSCDIHIRVHPIITLATGVSAAIFMNYEQFYFWNVTGPWGSPEPLRQAMITAAREITEKARLSDSRMTPPSMLIEMLLSGNSPYYKSFSTRIKKENLFTSES
jgi:hypothetical protein